MKKVYLLFILLLLSTMIMPVALAVDFDGDVSQEDQDTFDSILEPVLKVYNLIKYGATVVAVMVTVFAAIIFITSGGDTAKREQAKNMIMYVVIGLIVIWVAPLLVGYLT